MNIELVADSFLPIDEFYETSLNLSQPLFPKDLEKIKINGSAYLKINRGLMPLDALDCDDFFSCQIDEYWFCEVNFKEKKIKINGTYGYISVEEENLWETSVEVSPKMEVYYDDITAFGLITDLYHYYLKIHSKILQVKIQFDENHFKFTGNDCLRRIALDTQYEADALAFEPDSDLPF